MPISSREFTDRMLSLLWGSWIGVGLAGFSRPDFELDFVIDLEPLIIATAYFAEADARLRDEALGWLTQYWKIVSRGRLKNLLSEHRDEAHNAFRRWAATVNSKTAGGWPDQGAQPWKIDGKPMGHRDLREPHLLQLRSRALFGVSAKAEIMTVFLVERDRWWSTAELAKRIAYHKRAVANALEDLAAGGVLRSRGEGNRHLYSLGDQNASLSFVGAVPRYSPPWNSLFRIAISLDGLLAEFPQGSAVAEVEVTRAFAGLADDFALTGIQDPTDISSRPGVWETFVRWADEFSNALETGRVGLLVGQAGRAAQP